MIPKQAIEKAIEGGWKHSYNFRHIELEVGFGDKFWELYGARITLDPSFWQALGKALGWGEQDEINLRMYRKSGGGGDMPKAMYRWCKKAEDFLQLILTGGDTKKFWEEILHAS